MIIPVSLGYNIRNAVERHPSYSENGNTLYVGGIGPNNYTTIQSAIDDAVDGNTVFVYDIQPGVSWVKTFGLSEYNDYIESVFQTSDDGFIMTGYTRSYSMDHYEDAWLVKTDRYGSEEWSRTFGESGGLNIDDGRSVIQTSDGGYIFVGTTFSFDEPGQHSEGDAWLVKTDSDGYEEWNETFGGYSTEHGNSVYQTSDGGYIFTGWNTSAPSAGAWLVKTDNKGVEQWSSIFYPGYFAYGHSVQQTSDGGYVMAGRVHKGGVEEGFLIKTDVDGNELWNKTYSKPLSSSFKCVQQTSDMGFIICGAISGEHLSRAWLVKTDSDGIELWNKTFNDPPNLGHRSIEVDQTNDGGYILVVQSHFALVENSCLIKTDFLGNKEWQLNIEGTEFHDGKILSSVQQTSDGGYVVAGINGNSWVDGLLIKVDLFENQNPSAPTIKGPTQGIPFLPRRYTAVSSDPDGDLLSFWFDWGDGQYTRWTEPFGVSASRFHLWEDSGTYSIRVKAMDEYGAQSDWSTFEVNLPRTRVWQGFLDMFPILERILGLLS